MRLEDLIIVSVDDHIVEPHDLFEGHVPAKWADRAPRVVFNEERGAEAWTWEGGTAGQTFVNAVVTLPNEEWGLDPASLSDIRPSCYDVHERIRDMNRNGTLSSLNFPSFANFTGGFFSEVDDKELGLVCLQAYNDWHIDQWCGCLPGSPAAAGPAGTLGRRSSRRPKRGAVARKGCRTICFTEAPYVLGYPSIHSGYWDPLFRSLCRRGHGALDSHRLGALGASGERDGSTPDDQP